MMARLNNCFPTLLSGRKKKSKESSKFMDKKVNGNGNLQVEPEDLFKPSTKGMNDTSLTMSPPFEVDEKAITFTVKVARDENSVKSEVPPEAAYEGGDEHDDILSMKRDFSDFDLQALDTTKGDPCYHNLTGSESNMRNKLEGEEEGITPELIMQSGHVSDPGMGRTTEFWGSPKLQRSCSNIETKRYRQLLASPTKSLSYENLQNLAEYGNRDLLVGISGSPFSVMSNCSADKVMLKKRSSSQVLPSRSRKLWWKLFLWSHRNLHNPLISRPQRQVPAAAISKLKGGYTSDTLEPSLALDLRKKKAMQEPESGSLTNSQNQWVAFSSGASPTDRVNAWVNSLEISPFFPIDDDDNEDGEETNLTNFPNPRQIGESSGKSHANMERNKVEEVTQANNIIQSLNSVSTVAHIAGMGLKVIPTISAFSSLRSVNLSGNLIVHIGPGTLPKGLQTLDLSRNKIATIEGLRELTRLRVLNLSYNRISRIGHGLSNCTLIKELYLAGNKISDVEGLHRLLKLSVLDLSFNKITTAKALGQLVANYNSLLALNLLGNPIQSNIGDDQLRKVVLGLLAQLAYLNKQPIKPQRAREVATDSVARAALGNSGWDNRRRLTRRVSSSVKSRAGDTGGKASGSVSSRHILKDKHRRSSSRK